MTSNNETPNVSGMIEAREHNTLPNLTIRWKTTLPIVLWAMWVGVSNWRLAGAVAQEGWIGTLSSIAHSRTPAYSEIFDKKLTELKEKYGSALSREAINQLFYDTNLLCITQEVHKAKELSEDKGSIFINVMVAVQDYERQVKAACEAWVDGIVSGAGLPLSLPEITKDYPHVALIPILSNLRGVQLVIKKWARLGRVPDAIVLEDPSRAGGHLGAAGTQAVNDAQSTLEIVIPQTVAFLRESGLNIPVIAAGGIVDRADINRVLALGASWVQIGTRFLATTESAASQEFKDNIVQANENDIQLYISNAMLPARALKQSGIFNVIKNRKASVVNCLENCLVHCAYRDGIDTLKNTGEHPAQMCILRALTKATEGNPPEAKNEALYFTGVSALRIHTIESVKKIMQTLTA